MPLLSSFFFSESVLEYDVFTQLVQIWVYVTGNVDPIYSLPFHSLREVQEGRLRKDAVYGPSRWL